MAFYKVNGSDLVSIASVIRSKTGTTGPLSFPNGFVDAFLPTVELGPEGLFGELSGRLACDASVVRGYAFCGCSDLTSVKFPSCTSIGNNAFRSCRSMTSASFPICTTIGSHAFYACYSLTSANFPSCTTIGSNAFCYCFDMTSANFPICTSIGDGAFYPCYGLISANFPICTSIGNDAFHSCCNLVSLYLTSVPSVPTLGDSVFTTTPIGGYSASAGRYGSVYVPASLYSSFLTATNWSSISSRIVSV